jgi:hypothetical protein
MADITRTGLDLKGNSDPGRAVRPANDFHGRNITMAVAVQAGQWVAINTAGKGVLADASTGQNQRVVGMATETKPAGQRVHCVRWGLMTGFTFPSGNVGDPIYLSNTAGESATAAGDVSIVLGYRDSDAEMFLDVGLAGVGLAIAAEAADVAAIGTTTNITAVPGSFADAAAVQAYLAGANVVPNIEARLDALETKVNLIRTNLRAAGLMA